MSVKRSPLAGWVPIKIKSNDGSWVKAKEYNPTLASEDQSIRAYVTSIDRYPAMSAEEQLLIIRDYQATGSEELRKSILLGNQRFIFSFAKTYYIPGTSVLDIVSIATIGMAAAIENFDLSKNVKFLTFAVYYMKQAVNEYMRNDGVLVKKSNDGKFRWKIKQITEDFFKKNERMPTIEEKIELLQNYDLKVTHEADLYDVNFVSIDETVTDDEDYHFYEIEYNKKSASEDSSIEDESKHDNRWLINNLMGCLNTKERKIIEMMYGINGRNESTRTEIEFETGLTAGSVMQIYRNAIHKMRKMALKEKIKISI